MTTKKPIVKEPQPQTVQTPLNDLVQVAIAATKRLHALGLDVVSQAAPVTHAKVDAVPSLMQLSVALKELSDRLDLRSQLLSLTLQNVSDSVKNSGVAMQGIADDIQKQLEALDVQLRIEKQFSRYLA
jgi:hypothetical protein